MNLRIIFFFAFFYNYSLQVLAQCDPGNAQATLDVNNVSAHLNINGDLWRDGTAAGYEVPSGSGKKIIYAGGIWMGGFDFGGNIHTAAQEYGSSENKFDYWPGPLVISDPSSVDCNDWNKIFSVERSEIDLAIADWDDDNNINVNNLPDNIKGWPAVGNDYFFDVHGFELPNNAQTRLAPFYDRNQDGRYDPAQGDFPKVKGDVAYWWVFNDGRNIHTVTQGIPINMEVQVTAYAYASSNEVLNNTTFYEFKAIHWGFEQLQNFYIGLWVDPDLGCWSDDFVGCVPESNMAYVYNGDENDQNCSGLTGYGDEIPVVAFKNFGNALPGSSDLAHFSYYLSNTTAPPGQSDPDFAPEYYNYLSGKWKDGTSFSQGGDSYDFNAPPYPYAFDGSSFNDQPWTECTAESNPQDRRFLMSYGPFDLDPGRISYLNFAVMSKLDVPHPCPDVSEIIEDGDFVEAFDEKMDEAIAELNPAPVAVYGFEKTGENEFDFTDQSYFNPTTWMWTFGDGNSSTEQNPTHDYENLGTYEVCLTVTNENGSDMSCNNIILEAIVVAPNAAFSYVDIGLIVDFTDISQNIPTSWFWNFGNGYTSTDQSPTHSYDAPGVYEVCLTATNDVGSDTFCEMISVVFVSTHFPGSIDYILKPNPVSTIAYIEFGKNLGTDSKLKVYNIIGEVVSLPYQLNNQQLELNVEDLAKGLYIFEVTDNDNNFVKGKFLVQ